ncbi:hypothetical protein CALCODRAFT_496545 [Calocera cornea HHB12733]|uniref:Uncharacterized protein n=1 Tax=Calocera cornea HHB12733 TaxID=1353952 RepID=A0A165FQR1_9BASI|nr:hypothetical protein CALCODRAFT_496545 [Calocera cornea HHB12733]
MRLAITFIAIQASLFISFSCLRGIVRLLDVNGHTGLNGGHEIPTRRSAPPSASKVEESTKSFDRR